MLGNDAPSALEQQGRQFSSKFSSMGSLKSTGSLAGRLGTRKSFLTGSGKGEAYNMRTGRVHPESSGVRDSEASMRKRMYSSTISALSGYRDLRDNMGIKMFRKEDADEVCCLWRPLHALKFSDKHVENEFRNLQRRTMFGVVRYIFGMLLLFQLLMVVFDCLAFGAPPEVQLLRSLVMAVSVLDIVFTAILHRKRLSVVLQHIDALTCVTALVQATCFTLLDHKRSLGVFGMDARSLCQEDKLHYVYCDNLSAGNESWLIMINTIVLVVVAFTTGSFVTTGIVGASLVSTYCASVLVLPIKVLPVAPVQLMLTAAVCLGGAYQLERRFRDLFDRTLMTREAMRRNRQLRVSFDKHVDNERTLKQRTQQLHEENRRLRKAAEAVTGMSDVSFESPLVAAIHELRDIQVGASALGLANESKRLSQVISSLQHKGLREMDISETTSESNALDSTTKEWLAQATGGWERQREINRKRRISLRHAAKRNRDSVVLETESLGNDTDASNLDNARERSVANFGALNLVAIAPDEVQETDAARVCEILGKVASWDEFDVIELSRLTPAPLVAVVDNIIDRESFVEDLDISRSRLINFVFHIDQTYCYSQEIDSSESERASQLNPYHNNHHAADVVQSVFAFTQHSAAYSEVSQSDLFAVIVAAAVHDYHHPGRTNQFLVSQSHPIAIQHNDQSPNERFHLAEAFRVMQDDKRNFMVRMSRKQRLEIRQTIIDLVLATDLAQTMKYLSSFQMFLSRRKDAATQSQPHGAHGEEPQPQDTLAKISEDGDSTPKSTVSSGMEHEDAILLLQLTIKVADIGHPSKPQHLHFEWSRRIQDEFFIQGDLQKESGCAVDPLCDRDNVDINKAQMGFIDFVCRPLVKPFSEFIEMPCLMDNLMANYKCWSERNAEQVDQTRHQRRSSLATSLLGRGKKPKV